MYPLNTLNTFGLCSSTDHFFNVSDEAQLPSLLQQIKKDTPFFVLGGGSNVVLNERIHQLVIHNNLKGISLVEDTKDYFLVSAASGEIWHDFVLHCIQNGWNGLENLAYIPGTVGASPVQNIGAYGKEVNDYLHSVIAVHLRTGDYKTFTKQDCQLAYRDSIFKHEARDFFIVKVLFCFPKKWKAMLQYADLKNYSSLHSESSAQDVLQAVVAIRQQKLPNPAVVGNAGSFFKNPIVSAKQYQELQQKFPALVAYEQEDGRYKLAAAWLIDQCGWKGKTLGNAGVHDRQALVIINRGGATAHDIKKIAHAIQDGVMERYGVLLEAEPIFVG